MQTIKYAQLRARRGILGRITGRRYRYTYDDKGGYTIVGGTYTR